MFAIAVSAMFTAAVNAAAPVISLSTSQPTIPGTSVASLAIGTSSPYAVSTVISDPTDPLQTSGVHVNITNSPTSFSFTSDNSSVVAVANCKCELVSGTTYKVTIVPSGVGYATVGLTASNGSNSSEFKFKVAASAASAHPVNTVFPTTIADASAAAPVGTDYMLIADDEANLLRLFHRNYSGQAIKTFDVTSGAGGENGEEFDIEGASASVKYNPGNRLYWITSLGNNKSGKLKPYRNRLFATDVTGTGADLTVTQGHGCRFQFLQSGVHLFLIVAAFLGQADLHGQIRVHAEAGGECFDGKIAVGNVVLNRVASPQYPNTIYGVIFDRKHGTQFSPVSFGTIYNTPSADSLTAAKLALQGSRPVGDCLYFRRNNGTREGTVIGNHVFY